MATHYNAASFNKAFHEIVKRTENTLEAVVRGTVVDVVDLFDERSPVDTGRFTSNWRVGINMVDTSYDEEDYAQAAVNVAKGAVMDYKLGDTVYVTNSIPYAGDLERGGSKRQAPDGIVEVSIQEYPSILRRRIQAGEYGR